MSETAKKLKQALSQLTREDRAELAHFLNHSLDDPGTDVDDEWEAELNRRLVEIEGGQARGEPVERMLLDLHARPKPR
jgi:putative addiction module component (TIGR02574 family)